MPDQTPVTDDDRKAHEWADDVFRRPDFHEDWDQPIARSIKARVPAPPATLADELRTIADIIGSDFDAEAQRLDALADRVEAVEKENRDTDRVINDAWNERDAAYSENNRVCAALATVTDERNNAWDRLADLQGVRDERDELQGLVDGSADELQQRDDEIERLDGQVKALASISDEAVSLGYWLADKLGEHVDNQDGETMTETVQRLIERLTRERTVKKSRTVALPDPADVPEREVWEVTRVGRRAIGFRRDTGPDYHTWALVYEDGVIGRADDAVITLVSRLVPDTRRVIDRPEDLDKLLVGSVVLDSDGDPWRKTRSGEWMLGESYQTSDELLRYIATSVTVVHEPMSDSDGGRTPDCPARG